MRSLNSLYVEWRYRKQRPKEYYPLRKDPAELKNVYDSLSNHKADLMHRRLVALTRCDGAECARAEKR